MARKKRRVLKAPKKTIPKFSFKRYLYSSFFGADPFNRILRLIGLIVFLYGAWYHNWLLIVLAFFPPIIGTYYEYKTV